jgi:hypothetical protein
MKIKKGGFQVERSRIWGACSWKRLIGQPLGSMDLWKKEFLWERKKAHRPKYKH